MLRLLEKMLLAGVLGRVGNDDPVVEGHIEDPIEDPTPGLSLGYPGGKKERVRGSKGRPAPQPDPCPIPVRLR